MLNVITHLDPQRFYPVLVFPQEDVVSREAVQRGCEVHILPKNLRSLSEIRGILKKWRALASRLAYMRRLRRLICHERYDLVYVGSVVNLFSLFATVLSGSRRIVHVFETIEKGFRERLRAWFVKAFAHGIIFDSPSGKSAFGRITGHNPAEVAINYVDVECFNVSRATLLLVEFGIGEKDTVITYTGFISHRKAQDVLIEAIREVRQSVTNLKVLLVGRFDDQDKYYRRLKEQVSENRLENEVRFLGQRDDIPEILSITDVFALPSRNEACPLVLLEAMAAQVPVVATDVGSIRKVLDNGVAGRIVKSEDATGLARAIIEVIEQKEASQKMVRNAYEIVTLNHTQDAFMNTINSMIESVLEKHT